MVDMSALAQPIIQSHPNIALVISRDDEIKVPAPAATGTAGKAFKPITILEDGWKEVNPGCYMGHDETIPYRRYFRLFVRHQKVSVYITTHSNAAEFDEQKKCSSSDGNGNPNKINGFEAGALPTMGQATEGCAPTPRPVADASKALPVLADFESYKSLVAARSNKDSLLIGFDSEWMSGDSGQERKPEDMLSWQFAAVYQDELYEFVFLRVGKKALSLELAIARILDHFSDIKPVDIRKIRKYAVCTDWKDGKPVVDYNCEDWRTAYHKAAYIYKDHAFQNTPISSIPGTERYVPWDQRNWAYFHTYWSYKDVKPINVTIVCHAGKVDISGLARGGKKYTDILRYCTDVQGGLVMLDSKLLPVKSVHPERVKGHNTYVYPVMLSIADTMCHAPAGKKALRDLGDVIHVPKIELPTKPVKFIEHMDLLLKSNPTLYFNYASNDSVVAVLYASAVYGYNKQLPVTVTSATARVMKGEMMDYLGCDKTSEFDLTYRGLQKVSHGLVPREDRPGYVESSSMEPISDKANTVQTYSSQAYHGGYNSCSDVGYFSEWTYDYDLENAYPTAMCLIPDIDWNNPIRVSIENRYLDIRDWHVGGGVFNPLLPFFAYVRFEFPKNVKYPCIPVNVDGIPIFPRTSDGLNGVYAAGPEIFLALKLGAKVWCETGYFLNTLMHTDKSGNVTESTCLRYAVYQLVKDRKQAKSDHGKGSLEELILKTMVNSGYGKNAQNVVEKQSWTAWSETMEDLGCSAITNPVSASLITSIVRAELLAAQNQGAELGYKTVSVTTDGFISDMPESILKSLDLYGFRRFMEQSRLFLTDGTDPEIWAIKHKQDDLVNFTTRGNVSLHCKERDGFDGVCAHNSTKSGYPSDSYEDRLWLMTQVLSRTGTVDYTDKEWTGFKELVQGKGFTVREVTRHIRMDFDMKRKPDRSSFYTLYPVIEGKTYEIANFNTVPFESVEEFRLYRQKKKLVECLRTEKEWTDFFRKVDLNACGNRTKDHDWAVLKSCIMGYRIGKWDIPMLSATKTDENGRIMPLLTVQEKCDWINTHNKTDHQYKINDWKDARKPARIVNMLPDELLKDKLTELMEDHP